MCRLQTKAQVSSSSKLRMLHFRQLQAMEKMKRSITEQNYDGLKELLESSQHSSTMLLNLINDLLDLAKSERMTFNLEENYFDLK